MYTNKNIFIFFFGLYFFFTLFANAQEKHQIQVSNQKCGKWLRTQDSAEIFFSAKNLTKVNYTELTYQIVIKDNDGNILEKKFLNFGRLKPNGEAFASVKTSAGNCGEISSIQLADLGMVKINGESIYDDYTKVEKIKSSLLDGTNLKFDVKKLVDGDSVSSRSADKSSSADNEIATSDGAEKGAELFKKDASGNHYYKATKKLCEKANGLTQSFADGVASKLSVSASSIALMNVKIEKNDECSWVRVDTPKGPLNCSIGSIVKTTGGDYLIHTYKKIDGVEYSLNGHCINF